MTATFGKGRQKVQLLKKKKGKESKRRGCDTNIVLVSLNKQLLINKNAKIDPKFLKNYAHITPIITIVKGEFSEILQGPGNSCDT